MSQTLFKKDELRVSRIARLLVSPVNSGGPLAMCVKQKLFHLAIRCEGGIYTSYTLRRVLQAERNVLLGSYSYGVFETIYSFRPKTVIGRYSSIGPGVCVFNANHPYKTLSTHPYFYTDENGREHVDRHELIIGHDVWLGANAIICPGCHRVGNGAIIGAGAVVTKDVADYAIVGGNPAKIIEMRFDESKIARILESQWWTLPSRAILGIRQDSMRPLDERTIETLLDRISSLKAREVCGSSV